MEEYLEGGFQGSLLLREVCSSCSPNAYCAHRPSKLAMTVAIANGLKVEIAENVFSSTRCSNVGSASNFRFGIRSRH